jgi:hypothetical protein
MDTFIKIVYQELKGVVRNRRIILQFLGLIFVVYLLFLIEGARFSTYKEIVYFFYHWYSFLFFSISIFLYLDFSWNFFHKSGGIAFYRIFPLSRSIVILAHFLSIFFILFLISILLSLAGTVVTGVNLFPSLFSTSIMIILLVEFCCILGMLPTLHFSIIGIPVIIFLGAIFRANTFRLLKLFLPPFGSFALGSLDFIDVFSILLYQLLFLFMILYYPRLSQEKKNKV